MKKITDFIVKKTNIIIVLFIFLTIVSIFLSTKVKINYDMTEYLPSDSETRIGMDIMDKEFEKEKESYLNIMFKSLTEEKDEIYEKLSTLEGVSSVDYEKGSEEYNSNEYTLYTINVDDTEDSETAATVYEAVNETFKDYEFYTSGDIEDRNKTILPNWILILAVVIVAVILIIMCESYIEPFLFLICIGIAVVLNNGTNIILGTVSNITSSISAILQLALSMDYSIMLINRYRQEKETNEDKVEAMREALYKAFSSISSSSVTTIVGLVTLIFMSFTIGKDLGLVLAKGVLLSLLVIFTCLPALILICDKAITKTKKKAPNITLNHLGNFIYRFRSVGFILLLVLFVGSYILKGNLGILYTPSDENKIADVFKENNQMAIIYNNKDEEIVSKYLKELENTEKVDEILAYGNTIGEKLKYNEFNDKLEELGTDTEIEEYLLKILYYNYYNDNQENRMTFDEFVEFIENNVLNNENFKSKLDDNIESNIKRLKNFTSNAEMNKKRTYSEIANILEKNRDDVYDLFVYYYQDKVNISLTIKDFVNFINNEVLTNNNYSSNISKSAKDDLKTLNKFLDKNTLTKSMNDAEMANLFGLDKNTVDSLYLYYYSIYGVDSKLSINEFANFVIDNVLTNPQYSNGFDNNAIANLQLLQTMSNKNIIEKDMNSAELSNLFGIDENIVKQLLLLKYTLTEDETTLTTAEYIENDTNWKQTPYQFVKFIIDNSSQPQISSNMNKETLTQLQMTYTIMNSTENNQKYSYGEISNIVGINNATTKMIYALHASQMEQLKLAPVNFVDFILQHKEDKELKGNINENTVNKLKLIDTVMEGVINSKKYSANEISDLLGLSKDDVKLLYSLYSAKHIDSNMSASLKEFVEFMLKDVITNEKYSNRIDSKQILKLNTINGIMNAVVNRTEYSPGEIFAIISNLTDTIDENTVEILYIYYGSEKYYQDNWTISIEEFINYINDKIFTDRKFDDFIEDDMRNEVADAKNTIQDNKIKLVGNNYSRIIMNTKFDLESDEVYEFIQKNYDNLEGAESYIIGDSSMSYEMSKTFTDEFNYISILTMIAIFIVVAITFKSLITPFVLVLIIQCAVYMTMGILGIVGNNVYFIALLIVQSILMGATIDYAIVYASYYLESREKLNAKEAVKNAYNKSIHTILTSSSILIIATFLVGQFASGIVSMLCKTLSQGVLCSTILILTILPGTMAFLDRFVVKKSKK